MEEKDYAIKISLEKRLNIYNDLSNLLMEHYPFYRQEEDVLTPIQDVVEERLSELNKQYIDLMNKTK